MSPTPFFFAAEDYLGRQVGHDDGRDETGDGADGAGQTLEDARVLRRQVHVAQEEAAHDGQLAGRLADGQQQHGHVAVLVAELADGQDAQRRQQEAGRVEHLARGRQREELPPAAPVEDFAGHQVHDQRRRVRHRRQQSVLQPKRHQLRWPIRHPGFYLVLLGFTEFYWV